MKRILVLLALLVLPGCTQKEILKALDNVSKDCERHYLFSFGGLITSGSAQLDCKASGTTTTTTTTFVPANPNSGAVPSGGQ